MCANGTAVYLLDEGPDFRDIEFEIIFHLVVTAEC